MPTNSKVIEKALRLVGVLQEGETPSAEQGEDGMETMNDLFMEWDGDGIDIGFFPQTDLTADNPIYTDTMLAATYNLALALAAEYRIEPPPTVVIIASKGYSRLLRDSINGQMKEAEMDHLPGVPSRSNILEG